MAHSFPTRRSSDLAQTLNRPYEKPNDHGGFNVAREISPKLWKDIWTAGQGVGGVNDIIPVAELCARLQREWSDGVRRLSAATGRNNSQRRDAYNLRR